jgi:hypothetical protein
MYINPLYRTLERHAVSAASALSQSESSQPAIPQWLAAIIFPFALSIYFPRKKLTRRISSSGNDLRQKGNQSFPLPEAQRVVKN